LDRANDAFREFLDSLEGGQTPPQAA
jgi:hypothetical protein